MYVAMLNLSAVESDGLPTYSVIHQPTYVCRLYFNYTQDAVDILDTLLDPRNDMSFQDTSTQVLYIRM